MAIINNRILNKLDETNPAVIKAIYYVQLEDLIERRQPRDTDLFRCCMERAIPGGVINATVIDDFTEIAGAAFADYHNERAKGATVEDGKIVYPAAADTEADTDADATLGPALELDDDEPDEDDLTELMHDRAAEMGVEVKG